jgi:uncharacterized membrane protein
MRKAILSVIVLLALISDATSFAASFQGLGDLVGGRFESNARGISADGSVVVGYGFSDSGYEGFRWTSSGGMARYR